MLSVQTDLFPPRLLTSPCSLGKSPGVRRPQVSAAILKEVSQLSFQGGGGLLWELSCLERREKERTPHSGSQAPGWPPEPETEGGSYTWAHSPPALPGGRSADQSRPFLLVQFVYDAHCVFCTSPHSRPLTFLLFFSVKIQPRLKSPWKPFPLPTSLELERTGTEREVA